MSNRAYVLEAIHAWDVFTFRRIVSRPRECALVKVARTVSHTGNGYLYPFVPVIVAISGLSEPLQFLKLAVLAFGIERVVYLFAKNAFRRKRPANILPNYTSVITASDEFSFPSGHSSAAFLMVTVLVLTYGALVPLLSLLYIWAAAVAVSRVVLGVHFPTDIMVGATMGTGIALFSFYL